MPARARQARSVFLNVPVAAVGKPPTGSIPGTGYAVGGRPPEPGTARSGGPIS